MVKFKIQIWTYAGWLDCDYGFKTDEEAKSHMKTQKRIWPLCLFRVVWYRDRNYRAVA